LIKEDHYSEYLEKFDKSIVKSADKDIRNTIHYVVDDYDDLVAHNYNLPMLRVYVLDDADSKCIAKEFLKEVLPLRASNSDK